MPIRRIKGRRFFSMKKEDKKKFDLAKLDFLVTGKTDNWRVLLQWWHTNRDLKSYEDAQSRFCGTKNHLARFRKELKDAGDRYTARATAKGMRNRLTESLRFKTFLRLRNVLKVLIKRFGIKNDIEFWPIFASSDYLPESLYYTIFEGKTLVHIPFRFDLQFFVDDRGNSAVVYLKPRFSNQPSACYYFAPNVFSDLASNTKINGLRRANHRRVEVVNASGYAKTMSQAAQTYRIIKDAYQVNYKGGQNGHSNEEKAKE